MILDVGNGMSGGTPENPKLIAQYKFNHYELYGDGWLAGTHSVFRYKNYLFVGDEVFPGIFHIEDRDRIPRAPSATCWMSATSSIRKKSRNMRCRKAARTISGPRTTCCTRATTAAARACSISPANWRGDLYRQGREIARFWTGDAKGFRPTCHSLGEVSLARSRAQSSAEQLDVLQRHHSGLWIAKLGEPKFQGSTTAPADGNEQTIH